MAINTESKVKLMKICVLGKTPVMLSMKRATSALTEAKFVDTAAEADLVVAENMRDIESGYRKEKYYAIITAEGGKGNIPENVTVFAVPFELPAFLKLVQEVSEKLVDMTTEAEKVDITDVSLLPDAKRILVIDDTAGNITSAKKLLAGHKLTVADEYKEAMKILNSEKFDVVLTDLYLPMSSQTLSKEAFRIGELVPYGFLLMCEAARNGATHVAIVTDLNHHADHFSAAFDHFSRFCLKIENARVMMMHALTRDGIKDWSDALKKLLED